ncbi:MAG: AraC family transcriptional regulator [Christensenellales bacterium]|jgi:YesN/AraC family two-component response regulator
MKTDPNLRELIHHHSGGLPIAVYRTDSFYYHWHEEYEFLYTQTGSVRCVINGQQVLLEPGMGVLLQSGDLHMMEMMTSSHVNVIVVHPAFWQTKEDAALFDGTLRFQQILSRTEEDDRKILDLFARMFECFEGKTFGYEFRLKALVCSVFAEMLARGMYAHVEEAPRKAQAIFSNMVAYVHAHYAQELTLETLVQQFYYSKSYIIRLFRQHMNMTPVEYIKRYRVDKAKALLQYGRQSVLEVAVECGFQNVSYFIRTFKAYTGLSPGAYRKQKGVS